MSKDVLQSKCSHRLMKEQAMIHKQEAELADLGIYVQWDREKITKAKAMIVGPEDTPYTYGFFFFEVDFPDNYPYSPPRVKFCTGDGRVRFNPNLYVEGKVCLSILGTWEGPGWTSIQNLRTVLITIQSLMSNHPITNEPGFADRAGHKVDKDYNFILGYETVSVGVLRMLDHTPKDFAVPFRKIMEELLVKNGDALEKQLEKYVGHEGKTMTCPLWNWKCKFEPASKLNDLRTKLSMIKEDHARLQQEGTSSSSSSAVSDAVARTSTPSTSSRSSALLAEESHSNAESSTTTSAAASSLSAINSAATTEPGAEASCATTEGSKKLSTTKKRPTPQKKDLGGKVSESTKMGVKKPKKA